MTPESMTKPLNRLLRGELAAVETYLQALDSPLPPVVQQDLMQIVAEHEQAVDSLTMRILDCGGEPSRDSGMWGAWAEMVEGAAKVLGDSTTLKALKKGEEHGVKEYQDVLQDIHLNPQTRQVLSTQLLPMQRRHLLMLERCLSLVS